MNRTDPYTHTFDSVTEDHTIEVRFEEVTPVVTEYTVTIDVGSHGTTTSTTTFTVPANTTFSLSPSTPAQTRTISFDDGIHTVIIKGNSNYYVLGVSSEDTQGNKIVKDTTFSVEYVKTTGVALRCTDGNDVNVSELATTATWTRTGTKYDTEYKGEYKPTAFVIPVGDTLHLTPGNTNADYKFIHWEIKHGPLATPLIVEGDENTGETDVVVQDTTTLTCTAVFRKKKHTITATADTTDGNGTIVPVGTVVVDDGASQTFVITPESGSQIASISIDGVPLNLDDL